MLCRDGGVCYHWLPVEATYLVRTDCQEKVKVVLSYSPSHRLWISVSAATLTVICVWMTELTLTLGLDTVLFALREMTKLLKLNPSYCQSYVALSWEPVSGPWVLDSGCLWVVHGPYIQGVCEWSMCPRFRVSMSGPWVLDSGCQWVVHGSWKLDLSELVVGTFTNMEVKIAWKSGFPCSRKTSCTFILVLPICCRQACCPTCCLLPGQLTV